MNRKVFWFGYILAIGALLWILWRQRRDEIEEILERVQGTAPGSATWMHGRQVAPRERSRRAPAAPAKEVKESGAVSEKEKRDDLQQITGIGPSFATRLQEAGITSYSQLANLTPDEVRKKIGLDYWRADVQSWIAQARELVG